MLFPPINPPDPTWIDGLGNILLLGAAAAVTLFGYFYAFYFDWRQTPAGRAVLYFVSGLVALLLHYVVSRFMGGDYLFRDVVRATVYGYLMVVSLRLLFTLWRIWRAGNHPTTAEDILKARERAATKRRDRERRSWLRRRERELRS